MMKYINNLLNFVIINGNKLKNKIPFKFLFFSLSFTLFILCLIQYTGSKLLYIFFSLLFNFILYDTFNSKKNYTAIFISLFLWLGFWLKLTIHVIFKYPYIEPVGLFDFSPESFNGVLKIGIALGLGFLCSYRFYVKIFKKSTMLYIPNYFEPSKFYTFFRLPIFIVLTIMIVFLSIINIVFGIQQSGLVPRTILIWPLNALIYWFSSLGFVLIISLLLFLDNTNGKIYKFGIITIIFEGFFSTISILSRSLYLFHVFPLIIAMKYNSFGDIKLSKNRFIKIIAIAIIFYLLSMVIVTIFRSNLYREDNEKTIYKASLYKEIIFTLSKLLIDRWIGIEGAMAVYAYPNKNFNLFLTALLEKSETVKINLYQKISNSHYQYMDTTKFRFGTLPGIGAFLFYSGSLLFVFFGAFFISFIIIAFEYLIYKTMHNPLILSVYGCYIANIFSQMGVCPNNLLKSFALFFIGLFCISIIQKYILQKKIKSVEKSDIKITVE